MSAGQPEVLGSGRDYAMSAGAIGDDVPMPSFGLKIAPGVSLRASGAGFGASVGPRVARLHAGHGGAGVSSGIGPLTVSSRIGGRSAAPKPRSKARKTKGREPDLLDDVTRVTQNFEMAFGLLSFGVKAVQRRRARGAQRAENLVKQKAEQQLCEVHLLDFPSAAPVVVPRPVLGLKNRLIPGGKEQHDEALREHTAQQAACDDEWCLLAAHDPAWVIDTVNDAFGDNAAPSVCIDAGQDEGARYMTLVVTVPQDDVVVRELWDTPGNPNNPVTREDRAIADVYRRMVSLIVVATAKEALAVAPAADEARVVVVRWDVRAFSRLPRLDVIYAGTFDRTVLTADWSRMTPREHIGAAVNARIDDPRGRSLRALPLRKHPDLQVLVSELELALGS